MSDDAPKADSLAQEQTASVRRLTVPETLAGERIDRTLTLLLDGFSRARVQALLRDGHVTLPDGRTLGEGSARVKPGDAFVVSLPAPIAAEPGGEDITLSVVYEDDALLVIDKPPGLVVHPAAGHATGTLVNALIAHCGSSLSGIGGVRRPGIVHRLDKDTSGLLVVAKTDAAHQGLSAQFQAHGRDGRLERRYLAVVWGRPQLSIGQVDAPLGRSPGHRTRIAVVKGVGGRAAVTRFEVAERYASADGSGEIVASRLWLTLETGRTHQIRVHMAHIGHPVLGDALYGAGFRTRAVRLTEAAQAALSALDRQALHAAVLGFEHPISGKALRFESDPPEDLAVLLAAMAVQPVAGKPKSTIRRRK
jgi:23S rRNA pseudouridine1911/1915/1917 synthase